MILWAAWVVISILLPCLASGTGLTMPQHIRHHQATAKGKKLDGNEDANVLGHDSLSSTTATLALDQIVNPHQDVRLECMLPLEAAPGHFTLGITWSHNGQTVDLIDLGVSDTGHRYSKDPIHGHLLISKVRLEDDGLWLCQYRSSPSDRPLSSKPIKLTVLDRPRNPYLLIDGRRLDPGNLFIPVKENTELSVSCVVEGGNPPPNIKWDIILSPTLDPAGLSDESPNKTQLNVTDPGKSDGKHNRVFLHTHTRSNARIDVLRSHHNGTVLCLVEHSTLPSAINASLLLDVQYSPSFAISREPGFGIPVREGIAVSLKCDVDSNPTSSPVWQKDDAPPPVAQSGDGFLNFSSIKKEDSGWYKCTSHHLLGEFSSIGYFLNVRYDPVVEVTAAPVDTVPTGRHLEVALGGAVQIQCPEDTHGCWGRVASSGHLEPVAPGPGLSLEDVLYQDAGEYRCMSAKKSLNDKWRSELTVDLTVKGRPVVYSPNATITAYTGQNLNLSLEFCAHPPATKTIWITEKIPMWPGQITREFIAHNLTNGSSVHCHQATLTITQVSPDDQGEYIFYVRSDKGVADGSILVNVTQVSGFSSRSSRTAYLCWNSCVLFLVLICKHWCS